MTRRPNILYFVADQMRSDSQHYLGNNASITPNLDALIKEGVGFRNAYCQNPVCVPSRCSFLSGLYPHTLGHRTMHFLQNEDEPNILKIMKQADYEVIWIGRNDVIPANKSKVDYCDAYFDGINPYDTKENSTCLMKSIGALEKKPFHKDMYSFYIGKTDINHYSGKADEGCIEACLKYLEQRKENKSDKPFFIYCTLMYPHPPYACSEPWFSSIDRTKLPPRRPWCKDKPTMLCETADKMDLHGWSEEKWNELRATYLAMVSKWDSQLGEVVQKLKNIGEYDSTSIFCFSDHGDFTGDYDIVEKVQNCFEDNLTNIPLLIKPANQFSCNPGITNDLAELVDLNPTIAEMTGVDFGYVLPGKSLMSILNGKKNGKKAVFCEGGRVHGERQAMELGHNNPNDMYWPRISTQYEEGSQHTKATMIRMGNLKYIKRLYEKDQLYDLEKDPMELNNLVENLNYQEELQKLKLMMLDWYQETADYVPNRKDIR